MKPKTLTELEIIKNPYSRIVISNKTSYHNHTFFEFSICLSGELDNEINNKLYKIKKGHIMLLRPQDCHIFHSNGHTSRDIYVQVSAFKQICDFISPTLYDYIITNELIINFDVSSHDLSFIEIELNSFNNLNEKNELFLKLKHTKIILHILDLWQKNLIQNNSNIPEWLSILAARINTENYMTQTVNDIIATTFYSHGYVCREFKKHFGVTLQNYLNDVKLSYSLSLLCEKDLSVEDISERLNYSAVANFIIAFKKKFGTTPAKWRKENN